MKTALLFTPFLFFLLGFYGASLLVRQTPFETPNLVGLPLSEAVALLSAKELNARILAQREKPDVEPGTIIDQVPHSGQRIKPHQSVFLEVAQQPKKLSAPPFIGLSLLDAQKRAGADRIRLKVWTVPDIAPRDTIIAQSPRAEKQLDVPQVTLYVSKGSVTTLRLVPDFKGVPLSSAEAHLKKEGVGVSSNTSADRLAEETIVLSQKPLAGSIVDLSKPTSVQLQG